VAKNFVDHEYLSKLLNLPQTLMSLNGLTFAHYVGCVAQLALMGLLGTLPNLIK
jgi:hypothetical protein